MGHQQKRKKKEENTALTCLLNRKWDAVLQNTVDPAVVVHVWPDLGHRRGTSPSQKSNYKLVVTVEPLARVVTSVLPTVSTAVAQVRFAKARHRVVRSLSPMRSSSSQRPKTALILVLVRRKWVVGTWKPARNVGVLSVVEEARDEVYVYCHLRFYVRVFLRVVLGLSGCRHCGCWEVSVECAFTFEGPGLASFHRGLVVVIVVLLLGCPSAFGCEAIRCGARRCAHIRVEYWRRRRGKHW